MQLATITPAAARTDVPTGPATREEAARQLIAVPAGIITVATMTSMTKAMTGEAASRADLVAPLVAKLPPEAAKVAILNAIDGAVALMPDARVDMGALRDAAAGIAALLADASTDHATGAPQQSLERLLTPLEQVARPIMEFAAMLDPSIVTPPQRG
jgi:hypothetical protein